MAKNIGYNYNLRQMFPNFLGCGDVDLQDNVTNQSNFSPLESSRNTLGLINVINQESYGV